MMWHTSHLLLQDHHGAGNEYLELNQLLLTTAKPSSNTIPSTQKDNPVISDFEKKSSAVNISRSQDNTTSKVMSCTNHRQPKPWILPRGLFPLVVTSPVSPVDEHASFKQISSSPKLPKRTPSVTSPRHEHGMSSPHRAQNQPQRNVGAGIQPVPWPMPPRLMSVEEQESGNPAPTRTGCVEEGVVNSANKPKTMEIKRSNSKHVVRPPAPDNTSSAPSLAVAPSASSTDESTYFTPPDSAPPPDAAAMAHAVFERIARLYPPAPRAPTLTDIQSSYDSEPSLLATTSNDTNCVNKEKTPRTTTGSDSDSDSVVDILHLFTDCDEPQEEEANILDTIRLHRRTAPLPGGVGDTSFLNVSGLRSLFSDDGEVLSTCGPLFTTAQSANSLDTFSEQPRPSPQRSRSDLAPPSQQRCFGKDSASLPRSNTMIDNRISPAASSKPQKRKKKKRVDKTAAANKREETNMTEKRKGKDQNKNTHFPWTMTGSSGKKTTAKSPTQLHEKKKRSPIGHKPWETTTSISPTSSSSTPLSPLSASVALITPASTPPRERTDEPRFAKEMSHAHGNNDDNNGSHLEVGVKNPLPRQKTGVVVRKVPQRPPMVGIRRAETGFIMSRAELQQRDGPPTLLQDNPNPKSLAMFDDIDMSKIDPKTRKLIETMKSVDDSPPSDGSRSSIFDEPMSRSLVSLSLAAHAGSGNGTNSGENGITSGSGSGSGLTASKLTREGRLLPTNRITKGRNAADESSSGLVGKLSTGLRRAALAVTKKTSTMTHINNIHNLNSIDPTPVGILEPNNTENSNNSGDRASNVTTAAAAAAAPATAADLTLEGTIDEAVCKICYVCRKLLDCYVEVRDSGRKIKVEMPGSNGSTCLRVSLLLTQFGDRHKMCAIKMQQNRSDAQRSNIATLWDFYTRLESSLRQMNEIGR